MEKKFLSHLPPRLVIGHRWYIVYYQTNPITGKRVRFRETYELNRIQNEDQRLEKAQQILDELNALLPSGYPFEAPIVDNGFTKLLEAVSYAGKVMIDGVRPESEKAYRSIINIFTGWILEKNIGDMKVSRFTKFYAVDYLHYLQMERKIGVVAWNNYLTRMKILFSILEDSGYTPDNPFATIKKKPEPEVSRRLFTKEERGLIAKYAHDNDPQLFLIILLIYHCFIRPAELARLRFKNFDLTLGVIHLPATTTKNKKSGVVTIPDIIKPYFYNQTFTSYPANYLLFGPDLKPHPSKGCHHNKMNNRHKKILTHLAKKKLIDPEGLFLYRWKDTGITDAADHLSLIELMKQARHATPQQTMTYYNAPKVLEGFKRIENNLF